MQKTEKTGTDSMVEVFYQVKKGTLTDFDEFDKDCARMAIYEQLMGVSVYCPVKLNNTLTQAFVLLQEKNPSENYINTLAVFTEMLLILSTNSEFISEEYSKLSNAFEAFEAYRKIKNGY